MTKEQVIRIETECGWTCFEEILENPTKHWSFWRPQHSDAVVFIEMGNGAKYRVCDGSIHEWKPFSDYRNMLTYLVKNCKNFQ